MDEKETLIAQPMKKETSVEFDTSYISSCLKLTDKNVVKLETADSNPHTVLCSSPFPPGKNAAVFRIIRSGSGSAMKMLFGVVQEGHESSVPVGHNMSWSLNRETGVFTVFKGNKPYAKTMTD